MATTTLQDSISSFISLLGSEIDPNASFKLGQDCGIDIAQWYRNGGVAEKVVEFWPEKMASGFTVNVGAGDRANANKNRAEMAQKWITEELSRLDVLSIFETAERQCYAMGAAPIIVATDKTSKDGRSYQEVSNLVFVDPKYFEPARAAEYFSYILNFEYPINHRLITGYTHTNALNEAMTQITPAERVLAFQGRTLLPSDRSTCHLFMKKWGLPIIGDATMSAALRLDAAIAAASILVQQKNHSVVKIAGMMEALKGAGSGMTAKDCAEIVKLMERCRSLLNVALIDKDNMDEEYVERNLAGVKDAITAIKEDFLMHCPGIPESYLFGMNSKGGLQRNNNETEQVDQMADLMFERRWVPQLKKLLQMMLNGRSCPIKGLRPSLVSFGRESLRQPDPLGQAQLRNTLIDGDVKLFNIGAITPNEARSREIGVGYQQELNLEGAIGKAASIES